MGYMHVPNLYKPEAQQILEFKRLYALEKIHGTSAHISWNTGTLVFFSGGESHDRFVALFDQAALTAIFMEKFGSTVQPPVIVYGEAYGGKQQGMSATYGPDLKFVAFDVKIGDSWLSVPQAAALVANLGLEFVAYDLIDATLPAIDACRDLPSTQAVRNGITEPKLREGVVLRPPFEATANNGERMIAKHKRDEFRETVSPRIVSAEALEKMTATDLIVDEWVTPMRLEHVIGRLNAGREYKRAEMSDIPALIRLMQEDVEREAAGEIVWSKDVGKAIGAKTVKLFKQQLDAALRGV